MPKLSQTSSASPQNQLQFSFYTKSILMSFLGFVSYYTRFGLNIMNSYKVNIIIYRTMLSDKVKTKNLKGKQNKKKWKKNIDVSELFDYIQEQNNEARKKQFTKNLIVEEQVPRRRSELDPNRFKNRPKSAQKKKYDNSYKRTELVEDNLDDPWENTKVKKRQSQQIEIPAIVKPLSGHSYNPKTQDIQEIVDQVIDYEKPKPKKEKKIKKLVEKKIVPRMRNKKVRQEYLRAREKRQQRIRSHEINSYKKIQRQIEEKNRMIDERFEVKEEKKEKIEKANKTGRVLEGKKIGKKRYQYREYIPEVDEIGKKVSTVSSHDQFIKDRYDSIFRRGIMEPRSIKVHANKKKNIKVKEYVHE